MRAQLGAWWAGLRTPAGLAELGFALLCLATVAPLWIVRWPPIQDLPQHLAAIRVLHDYTEPRLEFERYFDLSLSRTQYLTVYLAADLLAYLVGITAATKLLLSAAIVATPYALRSLLRRLGRDPGAALFALPLTYNAHLILGFLNFVAAIPLLFAGLSLALKLRAGYARSSAVLLSGVALLTFYTHVVPFALLLLGGSLLAVERNARASARLIVPLVPAVVAAIAWAFTSPAGRAVLAAGGATAGRAEPEYQRWSEALRQIPDWLIDVLPGESDERILVGWALLLLLWLVFAKRTAAGSEPRSEVAWRVGVLAPVAFLAYFVTPASYDWIWPINARFPVLAALLGIVLLPPVAGWARRAIAVGLVVLSLFMVRDLGTAFLNFERHELTGLRQTLEVIPEGQRVAALVWDRGSRYVRFSPFLHTAAHYQAQRGGAVMFSFATFPQSPFRFRDEVAPPPVPPRWEWQPDAVRPESLGWYDYVITRGGPGRLARSPLWEPVHQEGPWRVFRRRARTPAG